MVGGRYLEYSVRDYMSSAAADFSSRHGRLVRNGMGRPGEALRRKASMDEQIKAGDTVKWTDGTGAVRIGTVIVVGEYGARVQLLDSGKLRWPARDWLTRIDAAPVEPQPSTTP